MSDSKTADTKTREDKAESDAQTAEGERKTKEAGQTPHGQDASTRNKDDTKRKERAAEKAEEQRKDAPDAKEAEGQGAAEVDQDDPDAGIEKVAPEPGKAQPDEGEVTPVQPDDADQAPGEEQGRQLEGDPDLHHMPPGALPGAGSMIVPDEDDEKVRTRTARTYADGSVRVGIVTTPADTGPGVLYPVKKVIDPPEAKYGEGDDDDRPTLHLRTVDGTSVRRLLGDGVVFDIEFGQAAIHPSDPRYEAVKAWAEATPSIEVVGHKQGTLVCQVCGAPIEGGEQGMSEHWIEYHVQNEEQETTGRPPTADDVAKANARRAQRAQRAAQQ